MKIIVITCLILSMVLVAEAQPAEVRVAQFNIESGKPALGGYDPVSYFNGDPKKGKAMFSYRYKGVNYQFSDQQNLQVFKQQPAHYEPAYGGWCAFAMGDSGEKVKVNPNTYKIVDNKLYLFYDFYLTNTLKDWNKDEKKLMIKADDYWAEIVKYKR
jgi:YHS domain-containing protein